MQSALMLPVPRRFLPRQDDSSISGCDSPAVERGSTKNNASLEERRKKWFTQRHRFTPIASALSDASQTINQWPLGPMIPDTPKNQSSNAPHVEEFE